MPSLTRPPGRQASRQSGITVGRGLSGGYSGNLHPYRVRKDPSSCQTGMSRQAISCPEAPDPRIVNPRLKAMKHKPSCLRKMYPKGGHATIHHSPSPDQPSRDLIGDKVSRLFPRRLILPRFASWPFCHHTQTTSKTCPSRRYQAQSRPATSQQPYYADLPRLRSLHPTYTPQRERILSKTQLRAFGLGAWLGFG